MTWKNLIKTCTISITTSLFVIMPLGYTSITANSQQQPIEDKHNPNINTATKIPNKHIFARTPQNKTLQENMAYSEARQTLIKQGWQPNLQGELPNMRSYVVREIFKLGYEEIKDCAGTGEGLCTLEFINGKGELLVVVTTQIYGYKKLVVKRWWLVKNPNITQQTPSNQFLSGLYWLGGTSQGLEIQGKQYRYYDEIGTKPWKSISDLKYIKNGVVFDGRRYWCLSTLVPKNGAAACSANGWNQEVLPFVGTRLFNFMGGSGTGQSITIKNDGTTTVKLHGTQSTSVIYQGKFSNPIIFKEGDGLLLKDNKIYQLQTNGQFAKNCKKEGKVCEADLYEI